MAPLEQRFQGILRLLLAVLFLGVALDYLCDARSRSGADKWIVESSVWDNGTYTARYAYLDRRTGLLRLYETKSGRLLAERTFIYPDKIRLDWEPGMVVYSTNESSFLHDGAIEFPPSTLDRILAFFP